MRSPRRPTLLRALSAAFALVVALAASAPLYEYVWCAGSGETHISCCCPVAPRDTDRLQKPCCESRASFSPEASHAHDNGPRVLAAAPAAPVAILVAATPETVVAIPPARGRARAGPSERIHALHSLYLL